MRWPWIYLLARRSLGLAGLRLLGNAAKEVEILVLRHQRAVLQRQVGQAKPEPGDRVLLTALSRLLPRQCWSSFFVTPTTSNTATEHPRRPMRKSRPKASDSRTPTLPDRDTPLIRHSLDWLNARALTLGTCQQGDLDRWLTDESATYRKTADSLPPSSGHRTESIRNSGTPGHLVNPGAPVDRVRAGCAGEA
jgi:hypothetical protein